MEADSKAFFQLLLQGERLLELGRANEALAAFQQAHELSASHPSLYLGLATCYRQLKQFGQAHQAIQQGLSMDAEQADLHFQLGIIYFEQHNFPAAVKALEQALAIAPENGDYKVVLAEALEKKGSATDILKASCLLEKSVRDHPENLLALRKMAFTAMEAMQYRRAREYTERLARLAPEDDALRILQAELDQRSGKVTAARLNYQQALHEDPSDTLTLYLFYETYAAQNPIWRFVANLVPIHYRNPFMAAVASFISMMLLLLVATKGLPLIPLDYSKAIAIICFSPFVIFWVARLPTKWWIIWRTRPYPWSWRESCFLFLDLSGAVASSCYMAFLFTNSSLAATTAVFLIIYGIYSGALIFYIPFLYQRWAIGVLVLIYGCGLINFVFAALGHRPPRVTDMIAGLSWIALIFLLCFIVWLIERKQNKS